MNKFRQQFMILAIGTVALFGLTAGVACHKATSDQDMTAAVKSRIASDPQLQGQNLHVDTNNGVVTLTGSATTDDLKAQAERDAQAAGAARVDNQLTVSSATAMAANTAQPASAESAEQPALAPTRHPHTTSRHRTFPARHSSASGSSDTGSTASTSGGETLAAVPAPRNVTIPAGTELPIRLSQTISSDTATAGQTFKGEISAPITVGDQEVIPAGASATGAVVSAASSGHFEGRSELTLHLASISYNGNSYEVSAADWKQYGPSRGSRTGKVVGGGAGLGALIGALAHGKKGAVIGAVAGAGAGTAAQVVTKPAQVKLPAETVVTFKISDPLSVRPSGAVLQQ